MTRDPRTDPAPGDVLTRLDHSVTVQVVAPGIVVAVRAWTNGARVNLRRTFAEWRAEMARMSIVYAAPAAVSASGAA